MRGEQEVRRRNQNSKKGIAPLVIALIAIIVCASVAGAAYYVATQLSVSNLEPNPTPTPTATFTPSPSPTPNPTPTPTPAPSPSPTPTPTSSPTPSPAPSPSPTATPTSTLTVTSPNGGNTWYVGKEHTVTWTSTGDVGDGVRIELIASSIDIPLELLAFNVPNEGSWDVSISISTLPYDEYKIKITSVTYPEITDASDDYFTITMPAIAGTLAVVSPNGGEVWAAGLTYTVTWSYTGFPGTEVNIDLMKGNSLNSIIASSTPNDGFYSWSISGGQETGVEYKIRISSTIDSEINDTSDNNFEITIPGTLTVVSPNGGEAWDAYSTHDITWSSVGIVGDHVKIELLETEFLDDNYYVDSIIASSTPNDGFYSWSIPGGQDTDVEYKIRISSTIDSEINDTSDNSFRVEAAGSLTVVSPNGGEVWAAGSTYTVTWTSTGNIGDNVRITLYSGIDSYDISSDTPNDGSYSWTIPDEQLGLSNYRLRISSKHTSASDYSDEYFSITALALSVVSPNGGEVWAAGSTHIITWTSTANVGDNVRIELVEIGEIGTIDIVYSTIASGTPNDGSYSWAIPDSIKLIDQYLISISSTTTTSADLSDHFFTITGALTVTSPNGGESWVAGSTHTITWASSGSPGADVNIQLLKGGTINSVINPSTSTSSGSYSWTIPAGQTAGSDYRIRVNSLSNYMFTDTSDADFSITPTGITVLSPNGGESWEAGTTHTITWSSIGNAGANVLIELRKGSIVDSVITSSTANGGSYSWTIPVGQTAGSDYKIWIASTATASIRDSSDGYFSITPLTGITVTVPHVGQSWETGSTYTIYWTSSGSPGANVNIELLKGGAVSSVIATGVSTSSGSYSWTIPVGQTAGSDYQVRITSTSTSATDTSDGYFQITPPPSITVVSPNGGESWEAGSTHTITWTSSGSPGTTVRIELRKSGAVSSVIATGVSTSSGSYSWTIPAGQTAGSDYRIWVSATSTVVTSDDSDGYFSITPPTSITVTTPGGLVSWEAGSTHSITWSYSGSPGANVNIELLKGGAVSSVIATGVSTSSGSYSWTIPVGQTAGSDYQVRITSTSTSATDTSDGYFQITALSITVTSPNGGESWVAGSTHTITWTSTGNVGSNVKITLYVGTTTIGISTIISSTPNGGSYSWTIPGSELISSYYRIEVSSTSNPSISDTSDGYFTITGSITVTSPNGGEGWYAGTTHTITWTSTPNVGGNVKIIYQFGTVMIGLVTIISSTPNDGSYSWTIPASEQGTSYKIYISSTSYTSISDLSDNYFSIVVEEPV